MGRTPYLEPYGLYFTGSGGDALLTASKAASIRTILAVGPLLVLAVAAKYAGLLFVPTVLALRAWWSWKHKGLEEMLVRLGIAFSSLVVSGFIAFLNLDKKTLTGLSFTTTNRVSSIGAGPILVMQHIALMEGIFFRLCFLGLLLCGRQRLPTGLLLFGSALLVPLYHTYKGELISLDKHLAFSMFFLAPLAGFTIVSFVGLWQKRSVRLSWFTALALRLLTFPLGLQQARNLYLVARIPIHNSYGSGYFWLWSKHTGEARSAENVVRGTIEKVDTKASLNEPSGDCLYRYNA